MSLFSLGRAAAFFSIVCGSSLAPAVSIETDTGRINALTGSQFASAVTDWLGNNSKNSVAKLENELTDKMKSQVNEALAIKMQIGFHQ